MALTFWAIEWWAANVSQMDIGVLFWRVPQKAIKSFNANPAQLKPGR
jgi:hypothetical protein